MIEHESHLLYDLREFSQENAIGEIVAAAHRCSDQGLPTMTALIVREDFAIGIFRLFVSCLGATGDRISMFTNEEEARVWLNAVAPQAQSSSWVDPRTDSSQRGRNGGGEPQVDRVVL